MDWVELLKNANDEDIQTVHSYSLWCKRWRAIDDTFEYVIVQNCNWSKTKKWMILRDGEWKLVATCFPMLRPTHYCRMAGPDGRRPAEIY